MKRLAVYILASQRNGTLYTGVTGNLIRRLWEYGENQREGFTKRYHVHRLARILHLNGKIKLLIEAISLSPICFQKVS